MVIAPSPAFAVAKSLYEEDPSNYDESTLLGARKDSYASLNMFMTQ